MHGYQIVRTQFFASASKTSMSISPRGIRFSAACIRKFPETEYIEVKVHPFTSMLAIVPCNVRHKNKMRWAKILDDSISARTMSARAFLGILYELFGWDEKMRYRLRGEIVGNGKDMYAIFDANTPEIFTSRHDYGMPWATSFGEDFHLYKTSRSETIEMPYTFSEYNNEPDLRPSSQKVAKQHVKAMIEKMQKVSD